jgi:hypothetical protein
VQVGLNAVADRYTPLLSEGEITGGVAGGVHDEGAAVAKADQVRRVAEALIDERDDRRSGSPHRGLPPAMTM